MPARWRVWSWPGSLLSRMLVTTRPPALSEVGTWRAGREKKGSEKKEKKGSEPFNPFGYSAGPFTWDWIKGL